MHNIPRKELFIAKLFGVWPSIRLNRYRKEISGSVINVDISEHRFVFIGGLHRSGTTPLSRCLESHPEISGLKNTSVYENEGQHLQTVYLPDYFHGGPGLFGFDPASHLTENSCGISSETKIKLFNEWSSYWDLSKPVLAEKSPPNLIRTRFLQKIFPQSYFIVLIRHPIAVSLATQKKWLFHFPHEKFGGFLYRVGIKQSLISLLQHWIVCHQLFIKDSNHLNRLIIIKYEEFSKEPQSVLNKIFSYIGIENKIIQHGIYPNINKKYFDLWRDQIEKNRDRQRVQELVNEYENIFNIFGYSMIDLERADPIENF